VNRRLYWNTAIIAVSLATSVLTCFGQEAQTSTIVRTRNRAPITVYSAANAQASPTAKASTVASWYSAADEKRVDLDLKKASLKDALKQLFDQAKYGFTIEGDAPDSSITVHAKNVKFSTALGLITDAAGVNWKMEQKDKSIHYTVGKSIKSSHFWPNTPWVLDGKSNSFIFSDNKPFTLSTGKNSFTPHLFKQTDPMSGALGLYTTVTSERQSTFICPHCKGQTTVVRSRQQPKCPKCGRTFQTEWQFCPFDSSKRPATPGAWKFCPLCGKEVNMEEEPKKKSELPVVPFLNGTPGYSPIRTLDVIYPGSNDPFGHIHYPCGSTAENFNLRTHWNTLCGSCCPYWNRL